MEKVQEDIFSFSALKTAMIERSAVSLFLFTNDNGGIGIYNKLESVKSSKKIDFNHSRILSAKTA